MLLEIAPKKQRWLILCFRHMRVGSNNKGICLCIIKVCYNIIEREVYFDLFYLVSIFISVMKC